MLTKFTLNSVYRRKKPYLNLQSSDSSEWEEILRVGLTTVDQLAYLITLLLQFLSYTQRWVEFSKMATKPFCLECSKWNSHNCNRACWCSRITVGTQKFYDFYPLEKSSKQHKLILTIVLTIVRRNLYRANSVESNMILARFKIQDLFLAIRNSV